MEIKQRDLMFEYLGKFGEGSAADICSYIISSDDSLFRPGLTLDQKQKSVNGSLSKLHKEGKLRRRKDKRGIYKYFK